MSEKGSHNFSLVASSAWLSWLDDLVDAKGVTRAQAIEDGLKLLAERDGRPAPPRRVYPMGRPRKSPVGAG
ncbi:hypothetical protein [Paludisphaera mucosa]|uniref:Ribbon-helix-helix protein CopG domain-containing protein n=1 Tax=Paludisphaera mucosa TaxID=3030827 RepID=A0ABT6FLQ8_9BACT|nr:hypothetical protein [Paludisphaera mucosa]MDG3008506.1 hypothetical protein [Paludisphaera mucosa]